MTHWPQYLTILCVTFAASPGVLGGIVAIGGSLSDWSK